METTYLNYPKSWNKDAKENIRLLQSGPDVIKKFMFNSAEHKILNAQMYKKKYQEIQHCSGSDKPRLPFFLLINVKLPSIVGILTFMRRKKPCSQVEHVLFSNIGARLDHFYCS